MLRRMKKSSALLMVMMMVITVFGTAAASADVAVQAADTNPYIFVHDSDTPYWHRSPHRINSGTTPAVYHLVSGGTSLAAYCCDIETSISPGIAYKRINLEDADYYSADAAQHIRFILANGFWAGRDNLAALASTLLVVLLLFTPVGTIFGLMALPAHLYLIGFGLILVPLAVMEISKAFGLIRHHR